MIYHSRRPAIAISAPFTGRPAAALFDRMADSGNCLLHFFLSCSRQPLAALFLHR